MHDDFEREIRDRVTRIYDKRTEFFSHLVAYVMVNGFVWLAWISTDSSARMTWILPAAMSVGWGMGLIIHMLDFINHIARERAVEREIQKEREWRMSYEKPKRDRVTRLSSDGELYDVVDDDETEEESPLRRR
jgi:hypothetical protein